MSHEPSIAPAIDPTAANASKFQLTVARGRMAEEARERSEHDDKGRGGRRLLRIDAEPDKGRNDEVPAAHAQKPAEIPRADPETDSGLEFSSCRPLAVRLPSSSACRKASSMQRKTRKNTNSMMSTFFGKYRVEYAPRGEKRTARTMIGIGGPEQDKFVADIVGRREGHADGVQQQADGHGLGERHAEPVERRDYDERRAHARDGQDRGEDKNEDGRCYIDGKHLGLLSYHAVPAQRGSPQKGQRAQRKRRLLRTGITPFSATSG